MATPQLKDLVLRSPAGSTEVVTFSWPLQIGSGQDKHDNGIDIIDTIKFVCDELPSISSAFEEINLNQIDTACYKTMTNLVDRFNKAVDSIVALEKGTSLPAERLNKFAHPSLLRHILQLVYNAAVLDPDKLNNYEPFSPEVYGETSYELVQQMIKHVNVTNEDTFIDLGSGVGQVVLQMAGSFPLKACIGIEKADTPALYAVRMDRYFRQFMAWFGKRFCEYKLIKGDFLMDEHRENITSSTLVFVNNFAFGPNVDHQLKERFADLRDGAKVVSSKSFCPLNFRITDRNLSDIGTIMHVSEIPPLKGSVSWTCKPVSYYLHVIDRTILERYFQRMKTQKGADNDHVGSSRTTRDRAKRDAGGQQQNSLHNMNHSNNNNNNNNMNLLRCTQSPTFMNSNNNNNNNNNNNATVMANGLKSRQRQMDMMDSSTESEGESTMMNGARKNWSEWCSQKRGKSSQSDDDNNNNNFIGVRGGRLNNGANSSAGVLTTKKRKKLTRKAAIASKSTFAVISVNKENKEEAATNNANANRGRKGRLKKGARGRKSLKIVGLDVLHKQTLLSTSVELLSKKLPPAPGCVDQQLTSLLTGDMSHTELDIPTAPRKTPYALQILLDVLRGQYMTMMEHMRSPHYELQVQDQIKMEQKRKQNLKNRASQLEKQIKVLIDDSVALLRTRMTELGISVSSPNELIAKAKEIVGRHKELQIMAKRIQGQVTACELEQRQLIKQQMQQMPVCKSKLECLDLCEATAHDLVLKEIANTLTQRKKLYAQVATLQQEAASLERQHNMLINTVTTAASSSTSVNRATPAPKTTAATSVICATMASSVDNICDNQPLQLTVSHKNKVAAIVPNNTAAAVVKFTKSPRRQQGSRDVSMTQRLRGQEWPDVPDVGKIEESNPEVLAQKILETGRKIEAGKFMPQTATQQQIEDKSLVGRKHNYYNQQQHNNNKQRYSMANVVYQENQQHVENQQQYYQQQQQQQQQQSTNICGLPSCKESPKVANFEHRLKSIITSVLNEDQEQRKQQLQNTTSIYNIQQQQETPKHYVANNVLSIKRKHPSQPATNIETSTGSNQRNILLHQNSTTSTNISPFAHGMITQKLATNKDINNKCNVIQQQQQQQQNCNNATATAATNLTMHHRRRATITATNLEQYALQQQKLEFKAPPHVTHITAREHLIEDAIRPPRSNSAHSDNNYAVMQPGNTNTKVPLSAVEVNAIQLSRPSSNSSQPDYTQVSPAKIALRRHLSQEKLHQLQQASPVPVQQQQQQQQNSFATKTIGDLVNGEIERTLEISHQSIINAVVNKSTVGNSVQANNSAYERSLINPNAQRPERVNVRLLEESISSAPPRHSTQTATIQNSNQSNINSKNNGNLATLAQAAYNHKLMQATSNTVYQQPTIATRSYQTVALPRAEIKGCIEAYFNEDQNLQAPIQEQYQQQAHFVQQQQQQQQQPIKQSPIKEHNKISKDQRLNTTARINRLNTVGNPPLEGLAASLQDHMLASRKYKEGQQHEERQRRASILTNYVEPTTASMTIPASTTDHQYNPKQQSLAQHPSINGNFQQLNMNTANGIKRNSPTTSNQPRPNKIAHYTHEPQKYTHPQQHIYLCNNRNQMNIIPEESHLINRNKKLSRDSLLPSPNMDSILSDERLKYHQQQQQQSNQQLSQSLTIQHIQHHQQLAVNSRNTPINVGGRAADDDDLIIDDETHWQHRVSSGFDRLVAFASTELHKTRHSIDTVDTGSTTKSCNTSPDSGIAHSSSSSSSNSDGTRIFLNSAAKTLDLRLNGNNTSSGSIQKDLPSPTIQQNTTTNNDNTQSSSGNQTLNEENSPTKVALHPKSLELATSTVTASVIESPPLSDIGLPRTPSPSAVVTSSPLIMSVPIRPPTPPNSANSNSNASSSDVLNSVTNNSATATTSGNNVCRIPLKYQRKSKITSSEKHYKKKFCERNWEFDCDDFLDTNTEYNNANKNLNTDVVLKLSPEKTTTKELHTDKSPSKSTTAAGATPTYENSTTTTAAPVISLTNQHNHHHKSSKFRPKGKEWNWSHNNSSTNNKTKSN